MAAVPPPEIDQIGEILTWIGFTDPANRTSIIDDAFNTYADIRSLKEKDISELSESFSRRTQANGRIDFGIRRTKKMKFMLHWVHDFYRTSLNPSTEGLNQVSFLQAITVAGERSDVRRQLKEQSVAKAKVASPGPLQSENKWTDWEPKFENYLSTIIGMDGFPLSYVIRDDEAPNPVGPHANFTEKCIACAPLTGVSYEADRSTVHQSLVSFTTGQPSEDWIKGSNRHKDGRRDMIALRAHFSGEGNATRRIAEADRLKETLHYKNERSLPFETFLTKCQKMYNIYAQHGEVMAEDAKIRFLFKNIQHTGLESAIEAMKAKITTEPTGTVSYTTVANHISTAVSELPDYLARNRRVSGVNDSVNGSPSDGIYHANGTINTGHHDNWLHLSVEDRKKVNDERSRLGLGSSSRGSRGGRGTRGRGRGRGGGYAAHKHSDADPRARNQITQLKAANAQHKRTIAGLKSEDAQDPDAHPMDIEEDAGNAFGGKSKKKKS